LGRFGLALGQGYGRPDSDPRPHVVAIDYGAKDNIFRNLVPAAPA
jgi:carbamoyl-phosphate synthase small subunit